MLLINWKVDLIGELTLEVFQKWIKMYLLSSQTATNHRKASRIATQSPMKYLPNACHSQSIDLSNGTHSTTSCFIPDPFESSNMEMNL